MPNYRELKRLYESMGADGACHHLREALEEKHLQSKDFSIRDLFEAFVPDGRELVRLFNPGKSGGVNLLEASYAVDTSAFSNITGQIVYSKVLDAFNDPGFLHPHVVAATPTQFNGEKIPGIGRIGDEAESIGEGRLYPTVGVSEEYIETPETTKRGFIVPITKEAVFFDRTGLVLQRAAEVAYWLGQNKEKRVLDVVLGVTNNYKRNGTTMNTYIASGGAYQNVQASNALVDWTDVENAELLFDAMTDPNTGEPVSIVANALIVPTALKHTARRIVRATEVRHGSDPETISVNTLDDYLILSSPLVKQRTGSDSTWFLGDPMRAFAYMENWPITVVSAPNNSEAEFTHDIVTRYKVSERGAAAVIEPRHMVKCTA
jgi:hypothetical protein